jgi:hypothetical protein
MPRTRTTAPKKVKVWAPAPEPPPVMVRVEPYHPEAGCRTCGVRLKGATVTIGLCGECLHEAERKPVVIPGARYGHA